MKEGVMYFPYSREELTELMGQVFDQRIEKFLGKRLPQDKDTEDLMTIDAASVFLSISKQTLYTYSSKRIIPCSKVGRKLFFSRSELTEWVKLSKKKTIAEIEKEVENLTGKK